jgi:hypothetical protein
VLVVASPLHSDVAAPRGDELASRMASLVAAALGGDARAEDRPMPLADARARSHAGTLRAAAVLFVDVRVEGGELRLTADLFPVVANAWDRVRAAPPPPVAHAYVHAPVAAEVRSYLAPVRLEGARVSKFTHDAGPVLAMACGDLEGAGGNDLVLVSRREVVVGHLEAGRFVAARRAPAASLGRRAEVPMREPVASAAIVAGERGGVLYVGWTDRGLAAVGPDLTAPAHLAAMTHAASLPVKAGDEVVCLVPDSAAGGFGRVVDCEAGGPRLTPPVPLFDAWSAADIVGVDGASVRVVAARDPSAVLHLTRGDESFAVSDVGAQLAVADLDQDGVPEVVSTMARGEDALVVSSWEQGGLAPRLRLSAPGGVDAVAVCPPEVDDAPSVVAAVGSEIWLVR